MKKNLHAHQTNDMVYPFCIVHPGKSFDVFENLFDNFTAEVEWGNEDYDHNPQVEDNGQYAPEE
jgi:hypothetical protein